MGGHGLSTTCLTKCALVRAENLQSSHIAYRTYAMYFHSKVSIEPLGSVSNQAATFITATVHPTAKIGIGA